MVLVSVIIPTFNRQYIVEKSIRSVLNQSTTDLELIIVDDHSTDETVNVISKIEDSRIRIITLSSNHGACYARNIGVKAAKGKYIAFQDSDDIWLTNKLEEQIKFIEDSSADFVFPGMKRIMLENPNKNYYFPNVDLDDNLPYFEQILMLNRVGTQTILCKRECFDIIGFDEGLKRFQDWDLTLQACKNFNVKYLRCPLVDSYIQENSISKSIDANHHAWESIYFKYQSEINADRRIKSKYLFRLANEVSGEDIVQARKYYRDSYDELRSKESLIFYLLSSLKAKKTIDKLLKYQRSRLFK